MIGKGVYLIRGGLGMLGGFIALNRRREKHMQLWMVIPDNALPLYHIVFFDVVGSGEKILRAGYYRFAICFKVTGN